MIRGRFFISLFTHVGFILVVPTWATQESANNYLLPEGSLKAFAEYLPALQGKPSVQVDEYKIITKLQQELLTALKNGNDELATHKAQQLETYRAEQLNKIYAPAVAWLFSQGEYLRIQSRRFSSEIDDTDRIILHYQAQTHANWLEYFQAEVDAYQARLTSLKKFSKKRITTLVAIYKARLYNDRAKAITHTACTSRAWHLVEATPVNPGYQEKNNSLQKLEQTICNTEYPGIKKALNDYFVYWENKLKNYQLKSSQNAEAHIKSKIDNTHHLFNSYINNSTDGEIVPTSQFWSTGMGIYQSAQMTWLIRQYFALQQIPLGSPTIQQVDPFTLPPRNCPSFGLAIMATKNKAPDLHQNLNQLRKNFFNSIGNLFWDTAYLMVKHNEPAQLRMLLERTRITPRPPIPEGIDQHPLCLAICENKIEIVRILAKVPELINLRNEDGNTPLDVAIKLNNKAIIATLRAHLANTSDELGTPDI